MTDIIDRTGMRYGRWLVIGPDGFKEYPSGAKQYFWHCRCDCGNERSVNGLLLQAGRSKSCGCSRNGMPHVTRLKLEGMVFGRLKVIEYVDISKKRSYWRCLCDCGKETVVAGKSLKSGKTASCGCLRPDYPSAPYLFGNTNVAIIRSKEPRSTNSSGIRGVFYDKSRGRWVGQIKLHGKAQCKRFHTLEEAAEWRAQKERELFEPIIAEFEESREKLK